MPPSSPNALAAAEDRRRPLFVDALNVAYWCGQPPSLRLPIALITGLLAAGHDALLCFDASARHQLSHDAEHYAQLLRLADLAFEVPSGIPADRILLRQANARGGAILSRDRFRDHRRRYRRLIDDPSRLLAGHVGNDRLLLPALALNLPLPATTGLAWALLQAARAGTAGISAGVPASDNSPNEIAVDRNQGNAMPEYLEPGVYVEETSFRAKTIEGVATSTTGFAGVTRYGPVQYPDGPGSAQPRLISSYSEFERVYGGTTPLALASGRRTAYLAHAARAYFDNGGQRLHVSRVYAPAAGKTVKECTARLAVATSTGAAQWWARWPGEDGNLRIEVQTLRSKNLAFEHPQDANDVLARHGWGLQAKHLHAGALVEVTAAGTVPPAGNAPLVAGGLRVVEVDPDGRQRFVDRSGAPVALAAGSELSLVELRVTVSGPDGRIDVYERLASHPDQPRFIGKLLDADDPEDEHARLYLDWTPGGDRFAAAALAIGLQSADQHLVGGIDGTLPRPDQFRGEVADPEFPARHATGLEALGEIDDIAIVAVPDGGAMPTPDDVQAVAERLIEHAEKYRYRIAVVDAAPSSSLSEVRGFRGKFDSKYAALYHPWVEVVDPLSAPAPGEPPPGLLLPPSGFIAGIYARTDRQRGVHKAPANEILRGITRFEVDIDRAQQEVLNAEGVNCLRHFEGRGHRVWGARTMSADPEWKYVSLRRLCIYIEHSIDKATQWAVFEPNGERLWAAIRGSIEDFLHGLWRDGALLGAKPEDAYFVRCDRSTMSQHDLDNGRMICLIGIAPSRPAEFMLLRIGQWTADART